MPNTGNTSATGGYLDPYATPAVTEDAAFRDFWLLVILGIVGTLPAGKVWEAYQADPPSQPSIDVDWCAFHVPTATEPMDAYVDQVARPTEEDPDATAQRHSSSESLDILCSFYGPNCTRNAKLLGRGLRVEQNRAALYSAGVAVAGWSGVTRIPEQDDATGRWCDRADITISVNRDVRQEYPVLHLLAASGTTKGNRGTSVVPINWTTETE